MDYESSGYGSLKISATCRKLTVSKSFPPVGARNTTGHFFAKRVALHGLRFKRNYPARARGCRTFYGSVVCRHGHAPVRVLDSGSGRHGQITKQGPNTPVVAGANPAGPAILNNRRGVEFHSLMLVPAAWEKHDSRIAPMGVADHHRNACMVVGCVQPAMQDNFLRHPITIPAFPVTPESSSPALGIAVAQTALPSVRTHPSSRSGYVAQSALSSGSRTPPYCNAHDEAQ